MSLDPCALRNSLKRLRSSVQRLAPPEACHPTAISRIWRALGVRIGAGTLWSCVLRGQAGARRKTPATAEPGGRSLGELPSYLKPLPAARERAALHHVRDHMAAGCLGR